MGIPISDRLKERLTMAGLRRDTKSGGNRQKVKLTVAVLGFVLAALVFVWRGWGAIDSAEPMDYYYDLSAEQLFTAPRSAIPPIQGVDGPELDGVRAYVFRCGNCDGSEARRIAFLETHTKQLKRYLKRAESGSLKRPIHAGFRGVQRGTLVKRKGDEQWVSRASGRARRITTAWMDACEDGEEPSLCRP